jgi:diguanylate cyclase (GGDEF)-like protein
MSAMALAALAGSCVGELTVRMGPSAPVLTWLALVSVVAAVLLVVAGWSCTGRLRRAWWLLATAAGLAVYLHTAGAGSGVTDVLVRVTAAMLVGAALFSFPGTNRSARQWALLVLDGWLLGGSMFVLLWMSSVTSQGVTGAPTVTLPTVWVLLDLALASVVIALALRLPTSSSAGALLLSFAAVLICTADLYRALIPGAGSLRLAAYAGCWTAALLVLGMTPWVSQSPFARVPGDVDSRRAVRVPYVVACVAIAAVVVADVLGRSADLVLAAVVITLLVSLVASQTLLGLENLRLVDQVRRQADLFRDRATRDVLTGLPNRHEFTGRVELALTSGSRGRVAVLFVDLDGFKDVNDTFGHAVGDELLVEAATRLAREVRESDVVARFGGDEFVALLADCSDETAIEVAERLRSSLSMPYLVGHRDVVVSASIGLARPNADDDAESALSKADLALYRAKASGRDRVSVYRPEMHATAMRRLDAAARLRHALTHDLLSMQFQPVCDLRTGEVYAVEALLRFDDEMLSEWEVSEVIAAAEESGLIVPIGGWVLDHAVGTLGAWHASGIRTRMNVNVSARQLEDGQFVRQVENALLCHGVPASALCLEITEHHLVRDLDDSARELERLRHLGVRVALDDFGTGYSSLSYLPRLPIDVLKIDQALVARVGTTRDTVPSVLRLGRDLGLTVVAEGIERVEQLHLLRTAGCTLGQGHLLSRPLPRRMAGDLVRHGRVGLPASPLPVQGADRVVSDAETVRVSR